MEVAGITEFHIVEIIFMWLAYVLALGAGFGMLSRGLYSLFVRQTRKGRFK